MTISFRPAREVEDGHGLFVALTGGTNSGKTYSAMRLAQGIAGTKRVAVLDTEAGRTLHLKDGFDFDIELMQEPFSPHRFAEAAKDVEQAGYGCLLIDSFSMEWSGLGGVLDMQEQEVERMSRGDPGKRERVKMAAWIKPKRAHKQMVYSLLQRRIPIIFSIRGNKTVKPVTGGEPIEVLKWECDPRFPYEVTVSFTLAAERRGVIDLSDPSSFKMESAHREIFKDGDQLSEEHGRALFEWTHGGAQSKPAEDSDAPYLTIAEAEAAKGLEHLKSWSGKNVKEFPRGFFKRHETALRSIAEKADQQGRNAHQGELIE